MNVKYNSGWVDVANGATEQIGLPGGVHTIHVTIMGAGTGTMQPIMNGKTTHESYQVSDSTRELRITGVERLDVTAGGGAIELLVVAYGG